MYIYSVNTDLWFCKVTAFGGCAHGSDTTLNDFNTKIAGTAGICIRKSSLEMRFIKYIQEFDNQKKQLGSEKLKY
jgi:hypothetical protein